MDILEKLFSSGALIKVMRLFIFNDESVFDRTDIIRRTKISSDSATIELGLLQRVEMIKKRTFFKESKSGRKRKVQGYVLNKDFPYIQPLRSLLVYDAQLSESDLTKKLTKHGKVKLIITSGIFLQNEDARIDLLIVGDSIKENLLKNSIKSLEADIGKQLRYAIFNTNDFKYRLGVCDRLIRDILDYPHQIVIDKIGV